MTKYLIEKGTNYSYLLDNLKNPSFEGIRKLSVNFVNQLPEEVRTELWEALSNGVEVLESEALLSMYMYAYGKMHAAKLQAAFEHLPTDKLEDIHLIDWGCGQAMATVVYYEYLKEKAISSTVKTITLIEPSELALKRAALHARKLFPNAEIKTVKKDFDKLIAEDIQIADNQTILHLFSNVLDIEYFSIEQLAELIQQNKAYNLLICVSPYINDFKNQRLINFISCFQNSNTIADYVNQEWHNGWTIDYKVVEVFSLNKTHCDPIKLKVNSEGSVSNTIKLSSGNSIEFISNETELIPFRNGSKWGYSNNEGKIIIQCIYDSVSLFNIKHNAVVQKGKEYSIINKQGINISKKYDILKYNLFDKLIWYKLNNKWGLMDEDGSVILPAEFDDEHIIPFYSFYKARKGHIGVVDKLNNEVLKFKYRNIGSFKESFAKIQTWSENGYGFIDSNCKIVVDCIYEDVHDFNEGFAAVKISSKWGFIDKSFQIIIPCKYDEIADFKNGFAKVKFKEKWGIIDLKGNTILLCQFDLVNEFKNGLCKVKKNGKWGLINSQGKFLIPCKIKPIIKHYDESFINKHPWIGKTYEDLSILEIYLIKDIIKLEKRKKWFSINRELLYIANFNGDMLSQNNYEAILPLGKNCVSVKHNGKWGAVHRSGIEIIKPQYDKDYSLSWVGKSESLIPFMHENKWGFIDELGSTIITAKYDEVKGFADGFAGVKINNSWGFINQKDEIVIDFKYKDVSLLKEGLIAIKLNDLWGFINKKDIIVINFRFKSVHDFEDGIAEVSLDSGSGIINKKGEIIIDCKYMLFFRHLYNYKDNSFITNSKVLIATIEIQDNLKYGAINIHNEIVVPFEYELFDIKAISEHFLLVDKDNKFKVFHKRKGFLFECNNKVFVFYQFEKYLVLYKNSEIYGYVDNQTGRMYWNNKSN